MTRRFALLLSAAVGVAGAAVAADFPQWRGPSRDGKSADAKLLVAWPKDGPRLLWTVDKVDALGTGYGDPSVVGDKLFILGADGAKKDAKVFCACLSVKDGKTLWRVPLPNTPGDFNDGWGGGPRATPTVDGDKLYVLGPTGDLVCLATADGKQVWAKNLVKDFSGKIPTWGYSESVLIDGEKLVCTPGSKGGMLALDKKTGEKVWQCSEFNDGAGYSSIIPTEVGGVRQYVQQTMASGLGVRAQDGKLLWKVGGIGRKVAVIPTPVVHDNQAFFTAGYGAGCELFTLKPDGKGGTDATQVYTNNKVVGNHHGGVVRVGDYIYGHSDTGGGWVCFDYKKGEEDPVWKSKALGKGSVLFADGYLYCYSEDKGTLARVKPTPDGWQEDGRFSIPKTSDLRPKSGKVWAHPVIANGKLYLRDFELLYCYDLGLPGA